MADEPETSAEIAPIHYCSGLSPEEQRIECLRIAHMEHETPGRVVERAREYYNFVSEQEK